MFYAQTPLLGPCPGLGLASKSPPYQNLAMAQPSSSATVPQTPPLPSVSGLCTCWDFRPSRTSPRLLQVLIQMPTSRKASLTHPPQKSSSPSRPSLTAWFLLIALTNSECVCWSFVHYCVSKLLEQFLAHRSLKSIFVEFECECKWRNQWTNRTLPKSYG